MNNNPLSVIEGRWGMITYLNTDVYIGQSILNYGEYNPDETEFLIKITGDGLFIDIGANIGTISQALITSNKNVISFEPQSYLYKILSYNCKNESYQVALGSYSGITSIPKINYKTMSNFGGVSINDESLIREKIEIRTLDSYNFDNVDVIKIDVEGYEEEVLRGSVKTIERCKPILYIEDDRHDKSESIYSFLKSLEYEWVKHEPKLFRVNNFFNNKKLIWDKNYKSDNIVCWCNEKQKELIFT